MTGYQVMRNGRNALNGNECERKNINRIRKAETGKENSEEMNMKYSKAAGEGDSC